MGQPLLFALDEWLGADSVGKLLSFGDSKANPVYPDLNNPGKWEWH